MGVLKSWGRFVILAALFGTVLLSGCVFDQTNDSKIEITATEVQCQNSSVDGERADLNLSSSERQHFRSAVEDGAYSATPPYDESVTSLYDTLEDVDNSDRDRIVRDDGSCYSIGLERIYDD
jgi:outer membrane murein-binding lipoprotein Lpp